MEKEVEILQRNTLYLVLLCGSKIGSSSISAHFFPLLLLMEKCKAVLTHSDEATTNVLFTKGDLSPLGGGVHRAEPEEEGFRLQEMRKSSSSLDAGGKTVLKESNHDASIHVQVSFQFTSFSICVRPLCCSQAQGAALALRDLCGLAVT